MILHTWNSSPLWSNLLRLQCTCAVPTTSERPHGSPLFWRCQWPSSQPLSSQLSHNDSLWAKGITKSHREQGLDYWEAEKLPWCPSWLNSLWQEWSCRLVHCPGGNATNPIWRVMASSDGISSWTPLKPQHSNPNLLANQLWGIDFLTPSTPLIIPHRLLAFLESLMPLKNSCSIHVRYSKSSLKHSIRFCGIFPSFKQNFIAYRSSSRPDCIFEIHQLWQSGFSREYSNSCCSCSFESETIKIDQSSHKMHSNNILNFQEFTTILNTYTKKWKLIEGTTYQHQFYWEFCDCWQFTNFQCQQSKAWKGRSVGIWKVGFDFLDVLVALPYTENQMHFNFMLRSCN